MTDKEKNEVEINSPETDEIINTEENKTEKSGRRKNKAFRSVFDWVEMLVIALVLVMTVMTCIARHSPVDGSSMEDTLHNADLLILSDLFYKPKQGDIVVFETDVNNSETDIQGTGYKFPYVKRVIALGGQTVDIKENSEGKLDVYVDGELLDESGYAVYKGGFLNNPAYLDYPYTVPEGKVFVMGDNRNNSKDSRMIGSVDERCIIGRAIFRIFPFDSISVF